MRTLWRHNSSSNHLVFAFSPAITRGLFFFVAQNSVASAASPQIEKWRLNLAAAA